MGKYVLLSGCLLAAALPAQEKQQSAPARKPELVSPLGKPLQAQADTAGAVAKADAARAGDPGNIDLLLAAARARDLLWQFNDSIALYSEGIRAAPDDFRLYRHRGHRYISTRRFKEAVRDLKKAARLAPASFDVSYHLGLAYYLRGEFARAAAEYGRCLGMADANPAAGAGGLPEGYRSCASIATHDDSRIAITEWRYRALRRAGRHEEARRLLETIHDKMSVKENEAYYKTLLLYKGLRSEPQVLEPAAEPGLQFSTTGYGVANLHLLEGKRDQACALFRRIVESPAWSAFGYIASEVELASKKKGGCGKGS